MTPEGRHVLKDGDGNIRLQVRKVERLYPPTLTLLVPDGHYLEFSTALRQVYLGAVTDTLA